IEVSRDVTARRRAEAALAAREEELRQAQKMEAVGRLAGGIAHDFNNLLAAISSYAELLLDALPDDPEAAAPGTLAAVVTDAREDVREIRRAAERGATLTRQLLAFGRGQLLQTREIDLNTVVGDLGRLLNRVLGAEVELRLDLAAEPAPVLADPGQLEQVLLNLAVNARDAMLGGGVLFIGTRHVTVPTGAAAGATGDLAPGRYVAVDVRDTGVGMDAATLARIFEPFFTTKPAGQGTGLGLAMVYGIVAQTGGRVTVDSAPGRGTTFTVYLPALAAAAIPEPEPEPVPARAEAPRAPDGAGTTVLVVDDESAVRGAAARVLARRGYTVLEARDGVEALGLAERYAGPVHLLLSDVRMPGMDGRELARRFRVARPEARVLLMTGYPGSEDPGPDTDGNAALATDLDAADAFEPRPELGDAPALQKPFTLDALAERVREVTARAER
ncbi:MAG TPA: ATP-binding protein, partial [Gemmatirosa sp.]